MLPLLIVTPRDHLAVAADGHRPCRCPRLSRAPPQRRTSPAASCISASILFPSTPNAVPPAPAAAASYAPWGSHRGWARAAHGGRPPGRAAGPPSPPSPLLLVTLALAAVVAALAPPPTAALQLVVPFASRKCVAEDLPPATHVRGDVRVAAGNGDMLLDLFVTDTRGVVVYHASNVATSAFSFVTSPPSAHSPRMALAPYRFCFHHQAHPHEAHQPGWERRVTLTITRARTEPLVPGVARTAHVSAVETRIREVEDLVEELVGGLDAASSAASEVEAVQAKVRRWVWGTAVLGCVVIVGGGARRCGTCGGCLQKSA
eukprot:TRINITY_DN2753_c0_g1_i2.p1 TRINITY_DN2753_c0_g1~~TRINITY_DN2753_c0_g1_i2.p1  ORF type:complete len:317 (+),score=71.28 TRINITY_DN2753_c0_g1_i2:247-1197(+)